MMTQHADDTQNKAAEAPVMKHVYHLAEAIGPRGAGTPQEAWAAEYARQELTNAGLQPSLESFSTGSSTWRLYALASALALMAEALFLFGGRPGAVLASLLMALVAASVLGELTFHDNLLRRILAAGSTLPALLRREALPPTQPQSQNVWAVIAGLGEVKQHVLLIAHLDTCRTPRLFSTPRWRRFVPFMIPTSLGAIAWLMVLFVTGIFSDDARWRALSYVPVLVPWWISILAFEADYTPYSPGANDNATGVGVVLSLAARLKQAPLQRSAVWVLCSGSKATGGHGTADFLARHRGELGQAACCITLEAVGGAGTSPCYLAQEKLLTAAWGDAGLLQLASEVAASLPELGAHSGTAAHLYTEGRQAGQAGLRVLSVLNTQADGMVPAWHQATDTCTNVDHVAVQKTESFVWELLHALDEASQAPGVPGRPPIRQEAGVADSPGDTVPDMQSPPLAQQEAGANSPGDTAPDKPSCPPTQQEAGAGSPGDTAPDVPGRSPALQHAWHLAENIGPRGSTTPQEERAADYVRQVMEEAGLQPTKESFTAARLAWRPHALAMSAALLAELLFVAGGRAGTIAAAVLMIVVLSSILLEMSFQPNLLRWFLPKGRSHNVWARIPAAARPKRHVVLVAHLDSPRAAKMFSSSRWMGLFKALISASLAAMVFNVIIFIVGFLVGLPDPRPWHSLSALPAVVIWWFFVLTVEADLGPHTAGANNNATGVGVVLSLAARLKQQPLQATEVWLLCSGSKEVGCYGAADFFRRYRDELFASGGGRESQAYSITLDSVGGAGPGPCYLSRETFLTTTHSDNTLLRLADKVAMRKPGLGAYSSSMLGPYTEGHVAAYNGLRVLTLVSLRKDGLVPHWHQLSDVFANVDSQAVLNAEDFAWELLQALDNEQ
jgi:acetylornithine deacetylase/succinyl-diaminopimelate desuccinylase-like protein